MSATPSNSPDNADSSASPDARTSDRGGLPSEIPADETGKTPALPEKLRKIREAIDAGLYDSDEILAEAMQKMIQSVRQDED